MTDRSCNCSPPVLTLNNCCPNGIQLSPSGIPAQLTVASDSLVDIGLSLNGANVGNYSNVTSQSFSVLPTSNYNEVIITGSNDNGSSEVVCSLYGTTSLGNDGSYAYNDQNNNANILLSSPAMQTFWALLVAARDTWVQEKLGQYLNLREDATSIMVGIASAALGYLGQSQCTNSNGDTPICIPNQTMQACVNYANNQTPCNGSIIINNHTVNFQFNPGAFIVEM